jgi:excisionase family DNA binding protein
MYMSVKEAARLLNVSENKVRTYISSGELSVQRKGRHFLVSQSQLKALLGTEKDAEKGKKSISAAVPSTPSHEEAMNLVLSRLAALEGQIQEKWQMFLENQRLHQQIRELDQELAARKLEIEALRRDLVYQKDVCEKEIEDHRLAQQERWALIEREASEQMAQERDRVEQRLIEERIAWTEKLAQEQERFAQKLSAMRDQEGFWSRLMKMITWS